MKNQNKIKKEGASNIIIGNKDNALALVKVNLKETNINKQIEKIYTLLKPEVESKGIQFFFKNSLPKKEAFFLTDPKKIYAVLTHLIKNVVKNTHEGSIEFGYGGTTTKTRRTELTFFVKHTGAKVLKNPKKAISNGLVQNKVTKQENGLGLALSKLYVALLGGKIWAESDESEVARFYFTLPYRIDLKEKLLQEIPQC
ncbi:MAG TPA: HAMP domain-containing sensor histidine kinase [Lutibacter sp.]